MLVEIVKRILIGIVATALLSISIAVFAYEPISNRQPNTSYTSLSGLFIIYTTYSGPILIIAGVIWSFIIDNLCVKYQKQFGSIRYFINLVCYILAGVVSTIIFLLILSNGAVEFNSETINFMGLGIIASLIYYHILVIWRSFFNKWGLLQNRSVRRK
ncbi:hypothetical protein ACIQYS_03655 [Psychrobacillus sp. NPDC096426]|uniref:hypothetical protein n=1 Tax=Psychrobacillus sp. NPDC096426 TaxID=3364491 RepID=UPI003814A173